ncbi:hypothetical protein [Streptomyces sp. NPDC006879]|uniref:hypothetical protein n=1 Tax=Streptomyces sp. NPDC006879 TaxID=3364767 RepID=UPI0036C99002
MAGNGLDVGGGSAPHGSANPAEHAASALPDLGLHAAAHTMSAGMLAGHLSAALLCGLWLWRGESAAFALARALATLAAHAAPALRRALALTAPTRPAPPRPARRPRPNTGRRSRLRGAVHAHIVHRRGPPAPSRPRATAPGRTRHA